MKKIFALCMALLMTLILMVSSGCANRDSIERPDLVIDSWADTGYANKGEYVQLDQSGIKAVLYYDLTNKNFHGTLENTNTKKLEEISVEFQLDTESAVIKTMPVDLDSEQVAVIDSVVIEDVFEEWKVVLRFDESKLRKKDISKLSVKINSRVQDGKKVFLDTSLMKQYDKFTVKANKGVVIKEEYYAGRHQLFRLKESGLVIEVKYDANASAVGGTIKNDTKAPISHIELRVGYDGVQYSENIKISYLKPGERQAIYFPSISWESFEVYRPMFLIIGVKTFNDDTDRSVEIEDIF